MMLTVVAALLENKDHEDVEFICRNRTSHVVNVVAIGSFLE